MEEGEIVSLLGANGSGRTTTLKSMSGLMPVKKERLEFLDKDITNQNLIGKSK